MNQKSKIIIKETLEEIEKQRKACRRRRKKRDPEERAAAENTKPIKHRIRKEEAWRENFRR